MNEPDVFGREMNGTFSSPWTVGATSAEQAAAGVNYWDTPQSARDKVEAFRRSQARIDYRGKVSFVGRLLQCGLLLLMVYLFLSGVFLGRGLLTVLVGVVGAWLVNQRIKRRFSTNPAQLKPAGKFGTYIFLVLVALDIGNRLFN